MVAACVRGSIGARFNCGGFAGLNTTSSLVSGRHKEVSSTVLHIRGTRPRRCKTHCSDGVGGVRDRRTGPTITFGHVRRLRRPMICQQEF